MIARAIFAVAVAAALAWQVVRTAAVAHRPSAATVGARLWPSHPSIVIDRTMAEIGALAARGQSPSSTTLQRLEEIARKAPLAPEPFLIKGAIAQIRQQQELAERLFDAARARDPRSPAARYFLAERYLRTGRIAQALAEIATMSRLVPETRAGFGPALAAFAKTPGAVPQLRRFFRSSPEMESLVLSQLDEEASNADLILSLWGERNDGPRTTEWQAKLVNKLIEQGQFAKAYSTWRMVAGVRSPVGTLYDPEFATSAAPPPFNWTFASSGGVVEPDSGRLQVIYYGRSDAVLAEQMLVLPAGRYQLSMEITGPVGEGSEIAWTLTCLPGSQAVFRLPIDRKGPLNGNFSVPPGCAAQRLQLTATAGEFPQSQEFTVGKLRLTKVGAP